MEYIQYLKDEINFKIFINKIVKNNMLKNAHVIIYILIFTVTKFIFFYQLIMKLD